MAALYEPDGDASRQLGPLTLAAIRALAWTWYHEHPDLVVVRRRVLFHVLRITVRQLRPLFELLFGPEPRAAA